MISVLLFVCVCQEKKFIKSENMTFSKLKQAYICAYYKMWKDQQGDEVPAEG